MRWGLKAKFEQNQDLKTFLLNTKNMMLVEASPHDKFWGVGMSMRNKNIWKKKSWLGYSKNQLGILLMELRSNLKK